MIRKWKWSLLTLFGCIDPKQLGLAACRLPLIAVAHADAERHSIVFRKLCQGCVCRIAYYD